MLAAASPRAGRRKLAILLGFGLYSAIAVICG